MGDFSAYTADERLHQHIQRLQILHEIDQAILAIQDEKSTSLAALSRIGGLVPHFISAGILLISPGDRQAQPLAFYPPDFEQSFGQRLLRPDELPVDLAALSDGLPFIVHDLDSLEDQPARRLPEFERMAASGIRSYLAVPLRRGGMLIGLLNLTAARPEVFQAEHVQIAQEVADSLAVAIQEARLRRLERQRQRETEVMRDVMAALASASDLQQILEALLVNLHNLIEYDRAGLFLVDENEQMVRLGPDPGPGLFLDEHPVVVEMRRTRQPVMVADLQADTRFAGWPDVESVRGWLGAPLLAGERMLGFISLGGLEADAFTPSDVETMRVFASEVSQVLERAWMDEQTHRRTAELEVLSNISSALGQAEGGGDTIAAILNQVAEFFGAGSGALFVHDTPRNTLVIKACLNPWLVGQAHPFGEDDLWRAMADGQLQVISDVDEWQTGHVSPVCRELFKPGGSAVIIPLSSFGGVFGLLSLAFEARRRFSKSTINLFHAIAEIAGGSLRRAVVLEALEKQITIRNQHLSTLYRINTAAGEPLPLEELLDEVLETTRQAMKGSAACIHLLDERGERLVMVAQRSLPVDGLFSLEAPEANKVFWRNLLQSIEPVIVPDLSARKRVPVELAAVGHVDIQDGAGPAFIGASIRAKGKSLGTLGLFGAAILNYSIEDITLFTTIAGQIGGLVERARLVHQAELAAVVQERQRLARELHDSVTQLLYSQVLFSGAGRKQLQQGKMEQAESHLARIEAAAQQALKEMRLLVFELRPPTDIEEGLAFALERRLDAVERRTGMVARLVVNGEGHLDPATSLALYRIAEESLNNTLKHASAATVFIVLRLSPHEVHLEIADDGRGFDPATRTAGGMGLSNMKDRASALNGELAIDSAPGQGTRVSVTIKM